MNDEPLTPLQQSAASTGRRYFACSPAVYSALCQQIDAAREYPQGAGTPAVTVRGLPTADSLPFDVSGRVLISVECWRITPGDDAMLAPAIAAQQVAELTSVEYALLIPESEPVP